MRNKIFSIIGVLTAGIIITGCAAGIDPLATNNSEAPVEEPEAEGPAAVTGVVLTGSVGVPGLDTSISKSAGLTKATGDCLAKAELVIGGTLLGESSFQCNGLFTIIIDPTVIDAAEDKTVMVLVAPPDSTEYTIAARVDLTGRVAGDAEDVRLTMLSTYAHFLMNGGDNGWPPSLEWTMSGEAGESWWDYQYIMYACSDVTVDVDNLQNLNFGGVCQVSVTAMERQCETTGCPTLDELNAGVYRTGCRVTETCSLDGISTVLALAGETNPSFGEVDRELFTNIFDGFINRISFFYDQAKEDPTKHDLVAGFIEAGDAGARAFANLYKYNTNAQLTSARDNEDVFEDILRSALTAYNSGNTAAFEMFDYELISAGLAEALSPTGNCSNYFDNTYIAEVLFGGITKMTFDAWQESEPAVFGDALCDLIQAVENADVWTTVQEDPGYYFREALQDPAALADSDAICTEFGWSCPQE